MQLTQIDWQEYELIDSGAGEKLERFGEYILRRPCAEAQWQKQKPVSVWNAAHARFIKTTGDRGSWQTTTSIPESWNVKWRQSVFATYLSPFKHTGIFPEQSAHWSWMQDLILQRKLQKPDQELRVLNLFAYTGAASIVCTQAGAKVTHVDSSRAAIGWAKHNQLASGLDERSIRWILDDVMTFVAREAKRGVLYEGIIMDPPAYGHGVKGEVWDFRSSFPKLLDLCTQILSPNPLFVLANVYAVSLSAPNLAAAFAEKFPQKHSQIVAGELSLEESESGRLLSTGVFARLS